MVRAVEVTETKNDCYVCVVVLWILEHKIWRSFKCVKAGVVRWVCGWG